MTQFQHVSHNDWCQSDGSPSLLGITWLPNEDAWNFAVYSKHAEKIELLFYCDDSLSDSVYSYRFDLYHNKSGPVWHCRIALEKLQQATYYAYRIDGPAPTRDFNLHQFDAEKRLLDPYSKNVFFPPDIDGQAAMLPGSNEGRAALSMLQPAVCEFDWQDDCIVRHGADLIIYELHIRGFTARDSSCVAAEQRGTFLGVIDRIPYLLDLGITAVELMPVFQFDPQAGDYWGYMPLNFFAPHYRYAVDPRQCVQEIEFRQMVKALHQANIEVILDVVYNHTCEGDHNRPTYSFKGSPLKVSF